MEFVESPDSVPESAARVPVKYRRRVRISLTPIICTMLAGCFLLGAVALHDYLTPVFGTFKDSSDPSMYLIHDGHVYITTLTAQGLIEYNGQLREIGVVPK